MPDSTHYSEDHLAVFNDAEMAVFVDLFERTPNWDTWRRYSTADGRDAIEIRVEGRSPLTMRLTKDEHGRYLASGFDGWGLTVADGLEELLTTLCAQAQAA